MTAAPALDGLREYVRRTCGIALGRHKDYLLRQRLGGVARAAGCQSVEEFDRRVSALDSPLLRERVIDAITTGETAFFRDGHPWEAIRQVIWPELAARCRPVRAWSAGCSTGQEAYSLAMLAREQGGAVGPETLTVLATDVSAAAVAATRTATFDASALARGLTLAQIARHFRPVGQRWEVVPELRRLVTAQRLNLAEPFGHLGSFDLVLCRNVLIYFDDSTRRQVCDRLAAALAPGGVVLLGAAESWPSGCGGLIATTAGATVFYRKPAV